jgi:acetoin utilization deacetylase AcuC-like enzyme
VKVFYSPEYVGAAYAFETTRKAKWVADSLGASPVTGLELATPIPLTAAEVEQVHDPKYVRAVLTGEPRYLAESQGFVWDSGLWPMVLASNGGVVSAALKALDEGMAGSLSSGLHHARCASGAGFCTFNGLVLAARAALAAGADKVLILDLDAHCGGGTATLIADEPRIWQTDVAVNMFDFYGPTGGPNEAERINFRVTGAAADYLDDIEKALDETVRALEKSAGAPSRFDLCIYNAGMDPHEDCSTGGLSGITRDILAQRESMAFDWCRQHVAATAFVLAGGYISWSLDEKALVDLHRLTLEAATETV